MARRRHRNPYGPGTYRAPQPPTGSYDPALDAQRRAAQRGYGDLQSDIGTQGLRDTVDYGLNREDVQRSSQRGLEDLTTGRDRSIQGIDRQILALRRGYQRLGGQQRQQFQAAGLAYGGASLQARAKRAANEGFDRQPLDQAHGRVIEDFERGKARLGEDTASQLGRLALDYAPPDEGNPLGGRRFQDRATELTRAGRENVAFGLDTDAQKSFQASQAGWIPPTGSPAQRAFEAHRRRAYGAAGRAGRGARPRPGLYGTFGRPRYGANF